MVCFVYLWYQTNTMPVFCIKYCNACNTIQLLNTINWAIKLGVNKKFCSFWSKLGLTKVIFIKDITPKGSILVLFHQVCSLLAPFFSWPLSSLRQWLQYNTYNKIINFNFYIILCISSNTLMLMIMEILTNLEFKCVQTCGQIVLCYYYYYHLFDKCFVSMLYDGVLGRW